MGEGKLALLVLGCLTTLGGVGLYTQRQQLQNIPKEERQVFKKYSDQYNEIGTAEFRSLVEDYDLIPKPKTLSEGEQRKLFYDCK